MFEMSGGVKNKWVPATLIRGLGPIIYLAKVGWQLRYFHIDHLLQTELVNLKRF